MSDFLTRLALLNRGEASVVKPRLPGRYAPLADAAPEEPAGVDPRQPAETARPRAGHPRPLVAGGPPEMEPAPPPPPDFAEPRVEAGEPTGRSGPGREPAVPGRGEPPRGDPPAAATGAGEGPSSAGSAAPRVASVAPDRRPAPAGPGESRRREDGPKIVEPGGEALSDGPAGPSGWGDRPPLRPAEPLVPAGATRRASGEGRLGVPRDNGEPGARRTPDIHVTIGRVEVRAHTAAPVPRRDRAETPGALTLQDYLKRGRHGGAT